MRTSKIQLFISSTLAIMVVLFAGVGVQAYTSCNGYELANFTCTEMVNSDGTPAGFVVRLIEDFPKFENGGTTYKYSVESDSPVHLISHADLEFIVCDTGYPTPSAASVNGIAVSYAPIIGGGGDPSTDFLKWFPVIVKIDFPEGFESGTFSITVAGQAYGAVGNLGFKAGQLVSTGKLLMPVNDKRCGIATSAASRAIVIATKDGYKFYLTCNESSGCCEVDKIENPEGIFNDNPIKVSIEQFMSSEKEDNTYDVQEISVAGMPCAGIVGEDDSPTSPWYCSGGWCYY
jgi:hypothetical protein